VVGDPVRPPPGGYFHPVNIRRTQHDLIGSKSFKVFRWGEVGFPLSPAFASPPTLVVDRIG